MCIECNGLFANEFAPTDESIRPSYADSLIV